MPNMCIGRQNDFLRHETSNRSLPTPSQKTFRWQMLLGAVNCRQLTSSRLSFVREVPFSKVRESFHLHGQPRSLPFTRYRPCAPHLRELRQEGRQYTEPICKQWRGIWFRSKASAELRFLWFVATKAFLLFYGENRVLIMTLPLSCYQSNHDHPSMHPMEPQTSKPNARRT